MKTEKAYRFEKGNLVCYGIPEGDFQQAFVVAVDASDIPIPSLHHEVNPEPLKQVEGENKPIAYYAIPKESGLDRIFETVFETLTAQNDVGRILAEAKNVISYIVPIMKPIDAITDEITKIINSQTQTKKEEDMNWIVERLKEKSTWRGIFAALTALGIAVAPEVQTAVIAVGIALIGLVEVVGKDEKAKDKQ